MTIQQLRQDNAVLRTTVASRDETIAALTQEKEELRLRALEAELAVNQAQGDAIARELAALKATMRM